MANVENDTRYRAASLGALLARHYPAATPHRLAMAVFEMQAAARKAVAWEVRRCNEGMTERQEELGQNRLQRLQDEINAMLAKCAGDETPFNCTVSLGGDPRGPCARLSVPGQSGDGWGDGFAIY